MIRSSVVFCLAVSLLGALATHSAHCEVLARGSVYQDRNGNLLRDAGEKGIRGVCVSNGEAVVQTDARGRFEIPVGDDTIVFVVKPRGWAAPADDRNLPQFFYIHKPSGSPDLRHPGVAPTGALPESIEFPLVRRKETGRFEGLFFGDTQPRNQQEIDYIAHDIVEELVGADVAFGVTLGDLVFDNLGDMDSLCRTLALIGVPWHNVLGNHDMNYDSPDDTYSDETFERVYGPPYYAFEYGEVHFLVLDDVVWNGEKYHGELGARQRAFIANYLALVPKDHLVVLMMHIPIQELKDLEELFDLLEDRPNTFSLSAHWHTQRHFFYGKEKGWDGLEPHHHLVAPTVCGSWWTGAFDERGIPHATMADGGPNGYLVIGFEGTDYDVRFKAAGRPVDYQMNVYAPEAVSASDLAGVEVLVNVFAGSERSKVEMRLGQEGPWTPLERVDAQDPAFLRLKEREPELPDQFGRKLPGAATSNHFWRGALPVNAPIGTHLIHVRTTDMFGRTHEAHRVIRIQ